MYICMNRLLNFFYKKFNIYEDIRIWSYNGDFNRKQGKQINILKTAIYDGPSANMIPLYNRNLAKVPIVKEI